MEKEELDGKGMELDGKGKELAGKEKGLRQSNECGWAWAGNT